MDSFSHPIRLTWCSSTWWPWSWAVTLHWHYSHLWAWELLTILFSIYSLPSSWEFRSVGSFSFYLIFGFGKEWALLTLSIFFPLLHFFLRLYLNSTCLLFPRATFISFFSLARNYFKIHLSSHFMDREIRDKRISPSTAKSGISSHFKILLPMFWQGSFSTFLVNRAVVTFPH